MNYQNLYKKIFENSTEAFMELYIFFYKNFKYFKQYESVKNDNPQKYIEIVNNTYNSILNHETILHKDSENQPLAILESLDKYLDEVSALNTRNGFVSTLKGEKWCIIKNTKQNNNNIPALKQTGSLQNYVKYHTFYPLNFHGYDIEISKLDFIVHEKLIEKINKNNYLNFFVGGFNDSSKLLPELPSSGKFFFNSVTESDNRLNSIIDSLNEAKKNSCDIVIFPELTICDEHLKVVSEWLRTNDHNIILLLAGSFHFEHNEEKFNLTSLLDHNGNIIHTQKKISEFTFKNKDGNQLIEGIDSTNNHLIKLISSEIGVIATPICKDFCNVSGIFGSLWRCLSVNWFFVPSMYKSKTLSAHAKAANDCFINYGSNTLIANQPPSHKMLDIPYYFTQIEGNVSLGTSKNHKIFSIQV